MRNYWDLRKVTSLARMTTLYPAAGLDHLWLLARASGQRGPRLEVMGSQGPLLILPWGFHSLIFNN